MKDDNLALVYDNFDLQLASCENVLGVNIYAQIIFNMFQKQT